MRLQRMKYEHEIIDRQSVEVYLDVSKGDSRLLVLIYRVFAVSVTGLVKNCLLCLLTYIRKVWKALQASSKVPALWEAPRPKAAVDNIVWAEVHDTARIYGHTQDGVRARV
jgi:hypothetical protein